jgi:hypothetical protein
LPFSDDFRGHFDRMCQARAAIYVSSIILV